MKKTPKEILSRCVEEFELKTQVELVVLIRKMASPYWDFFWFYTLSITQLFWVSTLLWDDAFDFELVVWESFIVIGLSYLILYRMQLLKYLVPSKVKQKRFSDYAEREFTHLGITHTRLRSGLLIVFSNWENQCRFICDRGVKDKISDKELIDFSNQFHVAFQEKNLSESIGSCIRSFGVFWQSRWPNEDEENEIVHGFDGDLE